MQRFILPETKKTHHRRVYASYVNLLYYFHSAAGGLNRLFCLGAHGIDLKGNLAFEFAVTQDLYPVGLAYQSGFVQVGSRKFIQAIFLYQVVYLADIEDFIFNTMDIIKSTLG